MTRQRTLRDIPVNEPRIVHEEPTVFVVDDDVSVRESLEALMKVSGWAHQAFDSANAFLSSPASTGPSCLVLDVGLPDVNGLDLQTLIAADRAEMPIIFITGIGDVPTSVRAMKAGAVEFLTKPFSNDVLIATIEQALKWSSSAVKERASLGLLRERYQGLTRREREVMSLIVAGLLNKQVGGELGISEITVKAHRGRVMDKMGAGSLAHLVKMSERLGRVVAGSNQATH